MEAPYLKRGWGGDTCGTQLVPSGRGSDEKRESKSPSRTAAGLELWYLRLYTERVRDWAAGAGL
jgi:hypothetical protein|eukprot:COSAG06_NODE_6817_length_2763_cov_228.529279_3_plen_64_part_00